MSRRYVLSDPSVRDLDAIKSSLPVKFWPVFSYLVIYKPDARPLEVLRVLHAARDVAAVLDDTDDDV